MSEKLEVRFTQADAAKVSLRQEEDQPMRMVGYASVFNSLSEDLGGWFERIMPGAYDAVISSNDDVFAFAQHDQTKPIGRRSKGTAILTVDSHGLHTETLLPDTTTGRDLAVSLSPDREDISGMSIGFYPGEHQWVEEGDNYIKEIYSLRLIEYSAVTFPAYSKTTVSVRSLEQFEQFKAEVNKPQVFIPSLETLKRWQQLAEMKA